MWFRKTKPEPEPTLEEQLTDARVRLARLQELDPADLTIPPSAQRPFVTHGIDRKPVLIARAKADIAGLEIRVGVSKPSIKGDTK